MKKTPKPRDTVQRLKETIHKQPAVFAVYLGPAVDRAGGAGNVNHPGRI